MARVYIRTCQECLHRQKAKDPATYKDKQKEAWRDLKCKKCGSEGSMDYGSEQEENREAGIAEYDY